MSTEMERALEADGEKLRQLTGEDHGPWPRSFQHTIDWQFQREKDEEGYLIEVLIGYDIEPYVPGQISRPPEDCYPPEGGYVTHLCAFTPDTNEVVELTDAERKEVTDWIEQHHDHDADLRGDPDAAYEAWRDDQMARRDDWAGEDF
mgnify:FL=1